MNTKNKTNDRPSGKKGKKIARRSYTTISDALSQVHSLADDEISSGVNKYNLGGLLQSCMSRKRLGDGVEVIQILLALLVWPFLKVHSFLCELCQFLRVASGGVKNADDLIYVFRMPTDINWRKWYYGLIGKP